RAASRGRRAGPCRRARHAGQGLGDDRAFDVLRAVVGHRDRVGDRAAHHVGGVPAVVDRDAEVHRGGGGGEDGGLDQRTDERTDRTRTDVVVAVVDDVVRRGGGGAP